MRWQDQTDVTEVVIVYINNNMYQKLLIFQ